MSDTNCRLVTWNINSVRFRLDLVDRFLSTYNPDILCLQETKVTDDLFPQTWFAERGYAHRAISGQKAYHGVATLSKIPFERVSRNDWCAKGDARHIEVDLKLNGKLLELHNFYVPAGGDIPDPDKNDKFAHKLAFLDEMIHWASNLDRTGNRILVGDLNIAPLEEDVWSHKALLKIVSHTPVEVERMNRLIKAHDWIDIMRRFVPEAEKLYSWWSYRSPDWANADKGRRLDHIWASPPLEGAAKSMQVLRDVRGWDKPSDHAPVMVDFKF